MKGPHERRRVLITGMSGTGKSSIIQALGARGYDAHDLDTPEWSEWVGVDAADELTPVAGKDWVWREEPVRRLLSEAAGLLFVSGCASNQHRLYPWIDRVILLSAPIATIMARLGTRARGYGATAEERGRVARLTAAVEPLLRQGADVEIDTSGSVEATTSEVLLAAGVENG